MTTLRWITDFWPGMRVLVYFRTEILFCKYCYQCWFEVCLNNLMCTQSKIFFFFCGAGSIFILLQSKEIRLALLNNVATLINPTSEFQMKKNKRFETVPLPPSNLRQCAIKRIIV